MSTMSVVFKIKPVIDKQRCLLNESFSQKMVTELLMDLYALRNNIHIYFSIVSFQFQSLLDFQVNVLMNEDKAHRYDFVSYKLR